MTAIDDLVAANHARADARATLDKAPPRRHLAVVTCMDARIDAFQAFGLISGDAHVIRNAGGRVTDDVLRSLAVSSNVLGVDTVAVIQHRLCGMVGVTDDQLRERTGAGIEFHTIADHESALRADVEKLASTDFLGTVNEIAGFVLDVTTGRLDEVVRWTRDSNQLG